MLVSVLIALFGERWLKVVDARKRRTRIRGILSQLLGNLRESLVRVRDERNNEADKDLMFSLTSKSEVSHYFKYFEGIVLPDIDALGDLAQPVVIELFDHYQMNVAAIEGKGMLRRSTTNELLKRIDNAIVVLKPE